MNGLATVDSMVKRKIAYRLSTSEDAESIESLVRGTSNGMWDWLDWGTVGENWIIATYENRPVGCILVLISLPFAYTEMLCIDTSLPKRMRAVIARDLVLTAFSICKEKGASCSVSMVSFEHNQWLQIWQKRGVIPCAEGVMMVAPLRGRCQ